MLYFYLYFNRNIKINYQQQPTKSHLNHRLNHNYQFGRFVNAGVAYALPYIIPFSRTVSESYCLYGRFCFF